MLTLPEAKDRSDTASAELFETVHMLHQRTRPSNLAGLLAVPLVAYAFWPVAEMTWLLLWALAKVLMVAVREGLARSWNRTQGLHLQRSRQRMMMALAADGAIYGAIPFLLLPGSPETLKVVALGSVAIAAAVGVVVTASDQRACAWFLMPLLLPSVVLEFSAGTRHALAFSIALMLFAGLALYESRRTTRFNRAARRTRAQLDQTLAERERALELAEQLSSVKDRFLATMSHELRTPLHGLLGLTQLLRERADEGSPDRPLLDMMTRSGEHLLGVINNVLDFNQLQRGFMRIKADDLDLDALLADVAAVSQVTAQAKGLYFELDAQPLGWVRGDPMRLKQILLNLTGNAVKFTDRGGASMHAWREPNGEVVIEVRDSGVGVAAADVEAIFEPFQQGEQGSETGRNGTGLGLAISRELAHAMNGELTLLQRSAPGASFRLRVPLPELLDEPARQLKSAPTGRHEAVRLSGNVLLVEDNEVNALVTQTTVEKFGLRVRWAAEGEQALKEFEAERPDLILMDCQLPGMDGYELTRRIRAQEARQGQPAVAIIAFTALSADWNWQLCLDAGMDEHLRKPFTAEEILPVLERWIPQQGAAQRQQRQGLAA